MASAGGFSITIELTGTHGVIQTVRDIIVPIQTSLRALVENTYHLSQSYSPILTGALRASGGYEISMRTDGGMNACVYYTAPYALRRHYENNRNPQTLYYLERGANDAVRSFK